MTGISIRPITIHDVDNQYLGWLHDLEVTRYLSVKNIDKVSCLKHVESRMNSKTSSMFVIEYNGNKVGTATLYNYDSTDNVIHLGIMIGAKEYWGRGIGQAVTQLLIAYAKDKYHVNKIRLGVEADNTRAIHCYESNGFKRTGIVMEKLL